MKFADKLKQARVNAGLTQEELALQLGVTCRTLQNYESGSVYPKKRELYSKLATYFNTDINYWLSETSEIQVTNKSIESSDAQNLASKVRSIFTEGDLNEDDLDEMMRTIQEAYWEAKDKSKKCPK